MSGGNDSPDTTLVRVADRTANLEIEMTATPRDADTCVDYRVGEVRDLRKSRKIVLKNARSAPVGSQHKVKYDDVVYVVCKNGVFRLTKSPDGKTTSERRV